MIVRFAPLVALATFLTAVMLAPPANATLYPEMSLHDLGAKSDLVVEVRVLRTDARWLEGGRRIATFVDAQVVTTLKGESNRAAVSTVTFVLPGGEVGEWGQKIAGVPSMRVDDRVVVFLSSPVGPSGERRVVGLGLGVFFASNSSPTTPLTFERRTTPTLRPIETSRGGSRAPNDALGALSLSALRHQIEGQRP